jgi:hypothetical protein
MDGHDADPVIANITLAMGASGFCGRNLLDLYSPRGGYNPVGLRKVPDAARHGRR